MVLQVYENRIFSFANAADGIVSTLTTLERAAQSFVSVRGTDSSQTIYYCATDGKIYRRNLTTATEAALDWRIPSMVCSGSSMLHDPDRKSIIFPYVQLGLHGVAEYQIP